MLTLPGNEVSRWPGFLADGRILLPEWSAEQARLHVFQPEGSRERTITLPPGRWFSLGGEAAPGRVVLAVSDGSVYSSHLVDVNSGTVRKLADGLYPAVHLSGNFPDEWVPAVGSEGTKIFSTPDNRIVRLDTETGAQTLVFAGDQSRRPTQ